MGIAVVEVSREALDYSLMVLRSVGEILSVTYPSWHHDPCVVRIVTDAVPDGEHKCSAETKYDRNSLTGTITTTLRVLE